MGTTSAYAENTVGGCQAWVVWGNYLRVRGEYNSPKRPAADTRELPPRTRRIRAIQSAEQLVQGTTSAYAENTPVEAGQFRTSGNYLRVRGEYFEMASHAVMIQELPPRTRRILDCVCWCGEFFGTTSAYAENTNFDLGAAPVVRNYLRVRGEYNDMFDATEVIAELPPRTRRILIILDQAMISIGTTSAYAENTLNELGLL